MEPHIRKGEYRELISAIENEISAHGTAVSPTVGWLGISCTQCTCGVSYKMLECKEDAFTERINTALVRATAGTRRKVHLELTRTMDHFSPCWVDSKGKDMHHRYAGTEVHHLHSVISGPPPGCNLVLELPSEIYWPPLSGNGQTGVEEGSAPPGMGDSIDDGTNGDHRTDSPDCHSQGDSPVTPRAIDHESPLLSAQPEPRDRVESF
eukprot:TRINITY_DN4333_c0_g1_i2.p1 TRINITY_DN4333_c0_g1~~TRINITY_DN4333_c0_g1_i2.p1  ORF type:complete len:208 (-),score=16.91 TRINITY_DN4333_c0_g1_i2:285-908(-)